jgi:hypothetical protein
MDQDEDRGGAGRRGRSEARPQTPVGEDGHQLGAARGQGVGQGREPLGCLGEPHQPIRPAIS